MKPAKMLHKDIPAVLTFGSRNCTIQGWNDGLFFDEAQLERMCVSDDTMIFVHKEYSRVVALMIILVHRSSGNAIITHLYVEDSYRGLGVREQLFCQLREEMHKLGMSNVSLLVTMVTSQAEDGFLRRQCKLGSGPMLLRQVGLTPPAWARRPSVGRKSR